MSVTPTGTFAEYLRPLGPHMPPQLISPAAFESMQRTAQLIPGALALSMFTFESSLGDDEAVANFQLGADAALNARQTLAQAIAGGNMLLRNNAVWQRVYDFVEVWSYEGSALNRSVRNIWLEFDTAASVKEMPVPGLYFGLQRDEQQTAALSEPSQLAALCLKALALFKGQPVPGPVATLLTDAILAIPRSGMLGLVGALQREGKPVYRLVIQGLDTQSIVAYMEKIGWSGSLVDLQTSVAATANLCDYVWLSVDIEHQRSPRVAWECYHDMARPATDMRRHSMLDYMVETGLCMPAKRDGLLAYPGVISASASGQLWPESLRLLSYALGPYSLDTCTTSLHHFKIEYENRQPARAKAYLSAYYK